MDTFNIEFTSSEHEFIYNFGVNRGHSLSYSKVNRCLFLPSAAKQLYHNLCDYAYGGRRDCFPSQASLRLELGWSKQTLLNYLTTLEDVGLIQIVDQGMSKPHIYKLKELHKVPVIICSEIVLSLKPARSAEVEKFQARVEEYEKSPLHQQVLNSKDPLSYKAAIEAWFTEPKPLPQVLHLDVEAEPEPTPRKKKVADIEQLPLEQWNTNHFCTYFCRKYEEKLQAPYIVAVKDRAAMKRILDNKPNRERLKVLIDNFIALEFFEVKTITAFSSGFSQSVLDRFLNTGLLPSYKKNGQTKKINEEWARGLNEFLQE